MTIQLSEAVRNARLNAIESAVGTAPILRIYDLTGDPPANCAAAIVGDVLAEITCPSDWMDAASAGAKELLGSWADASANASGTADFFRLYASDGTTCHLQGVVGAGQDMTLDDYSIEAGQSITITGFTLTDGNA